jgi:nicotinamide mononucleotide transporter
MLPGFLQNVFVQAALIGLFFTALTFTVAVLVGWVDPAHINGWEVAAGFLNYGATYLTIKQRRFAYTIGVVASGMYALVYGQAGLIASAVLSGYLTITLIYGYFRWGKDSDSRPVHHLSWKWAPVYLIATAALYFGAVGISTLFGGTFAFWDGAILALTILAQLLLDQKVIETWIIWTLVNIVGVTLYFTSELYFAAAQQLIFGIANLWGFLAWRKSMHPDDVAVGKSPVLYDMDTLVVDYSTEVRKEEKRLREILGDDHFDWLVVDAPAPTAEDQARVRKILEDREKEQGK